ncbi:tRNA(Ile)-lysidine synthase [Candidatus Providencia siddallii]|uniref:tRNA(Ile)-lysidine synthase n=1 Tax=Candidatus Providencia siddallii TaxID=1715285 RepID=A0A0M6WA09_9GAMM|nr:tRNA(Ile)-lysidine synthase [Candidatus Providencia siddallii]
MLTQSQIIIQRVYNKISCFKNLLIGFSGGLDSTALLHILFKIKKLNNTKLNIRAIHVNHGLSDKSNQWEIHCNKICKQLQIRFIYRRILIESTKNNIEATAREARYKAYSDELNSREVMITAHHLNDQSETFLLSLKRGSGPAGLSSMYEKTAFKKTTWIIRPLLTTSRSDLEKYVSENQLIYIKDDTNRNSRYDRNYLRLHVMPLLYKRWPHLPKMIARSAFLCGEQEFLLDELLQNRLIELLNNNGEISIYKLQTFSKAKRNALIRRWVKLYQLPVPSFDKIEKIWSEVALAKQDANPINRFGQIEIRRYKGNLSIVKHINKLLGKQYNWDYHESFELPESLGILKIIKYGKIRLPKDNEKITVRFGLQGKINIVGLSYSKKAKKIWQEQNVPPWMRERIPLIYYNNKLITAVEYFITQEGSINSENIGISINWEKFNFFNICSQ